MALDLDMKGGGKVTRRLDFTRDYGTVYGGAATVLEQDGMTFNMRGDPVGVPSEYEPSDEPDNPGLSDDTLKEMDGAQLRELVESYGGTWKGPSEAMKFLRGQR